VAEDTAGRKEQSTKSWLDQLGTLIAVISSAITIALTVHNTNTKDAIDQKETELKTRDADLRDRQAQLDTAIRKNAADFERSKDEVARLKWIYDDLVPVIVKPSNASVTGSQNAAVAMIQMVLDSDKAKQLLVALQQSSDPQVRRAAEQGFKDIVATDSAKLTELVAQTNSQVTSERLRATGTLESQYGDSASAVGEVLDRLTGPKLQSISGSGLINALYFLSRTSQGAWTPDNVAVAETVYPAVRARAKAAGPQSSAELARVEAVVLKAKSQPPQAPQAAQPSTGGSN
jgi:hypothetical protein